MTEQVICMLYVTYHVTMRTSSQLYVFDDDSTLLQQDTAGFECTHSLDIKIEQESYPLLAPDGLTVVIVSW